MMRAANNAAIRSAIGLGQTDAPTFLAQSLTGQSLTGTQATSLVDLAASWNTTGTPTAIKLNVTDTASNAASLLMDLQVGGVSAVKVSKVGLISVSDFLTSGGFAFRPSQSGSGGIGYLSGVAGVWAGNAAAIGFSTGAALGGAIQAALYADAAGILAQRNGTAAQAFRVYNSTDATPATNFDRASFGFTSNVLRIGTEHGGTYTTARGIDFVVGGTVRFSILNTGVLSVAQSLFVASTLKGNLTTNTAYTATTVVPTGYITIYDSTNTPYRVPCVL
jgi:hypothetical protein